VARATAGARIRVVVDNTPDGLIAVRIRVVEAP
jgi:hypothetical protein